MFSLLFRSNAANKLAFTAFKSFASRNITCNAPRMPKLLSSKSSNTLTLLTRRYGKCDPSPRTPMKECTKTPVKECVKPKEVSQLEPQIKINPKPVGYWLLTCSGMVFAAVLIGGLTRLTESGLSMVHWKLFGEMPPFCQSDWKEEFEKYKKSPEFKEKNKDMTLEDFKFIWKMEYFHRTWGRLIGVTFLFPAAFFWLKGHITPQMRPKILAMGGLLLAQGLLGWWMVQSGLEEDEEKSKDKNYVPRVSQYRLAAHLGTAFVLYSLFFTSALEHLKPAAELKMAAESIPTANLFRKFAYGCKGLVFLTALSGAFVAGLDAGLVYNSFPKMGDQWIPDDVMCMDPAYKNFTENPTTVQLEHRILGVTTLTAISALWMMSRRAQLPPAAYEAVTAMTLAAWMQVGLGITTLLNYVKTELAAFHQANSLVLLTTAFWLTHELKKLPKCV